MERSISFGADDESEAADGYDLERRLSFAERRYAEARSAAQAGRDECHALEATSARIEAIKMARARYDMAEAKCKRLRALIERLEEKLD